MRYDSLYHTLFILGQATFSLVTQGRRGKGVAKENHNDDDDDDDEIIIPFISSLKNVLSFLGLCNFFSSLSLSNFCLISLWLLLLLDYITFFILFYCYDLFFDRFPYIFILYRSFSFNLRKFMQVKLEIRIYF